MTTIEPTELELAKLKASSEAITNIQHTIAQLRGKINIYADQQEEIKEQIEERTDCPVVPIEEWNLNGIDWANYRGKIIIEGDE